MRTTPRIGKVFSSYFRASRLSTAWTHQGPMNAHGRPCLPCFAETLALWPRDEQKAIEGVEQAKEDLKLACLSICRVSPRRVKVDSEGQIWSLNSKATLSRSLKTQPRVEPSRGCGLKQPRVHPPFHHLPSSRHHISINVACDYVSFLAAI